MIKMMKRSIGLIALIASVAWPAHADDELGPLANAIASKVTLALDWPPTPQQTAVQAFYEERGFAPLWVDEAGFTTEAKALIAELAEAGTWGLADAYRVAPPQDTSDLSLAEAEIALSLRILDYAQAARGGRIVEPSQQLSSYLDRKPSLPEPLSVLQAFEASTQRVPTLLAFHPQHEQFMRLRAAYLDAVSAARRIRDAALPLGGPDLREGMDDPQVALLKKRLGVNSTGTFFDDELDEAVKRFQRAQDTRRVDGIVGYRTRRALNDMDAAKLDVLRANMEQWRWMPADLGASHVLINIPEFKAELIKDGQTVFSERVVVGKTNTQTPIFSESMQTVVLHPRWYVPETIKLKEFLPSLLRGRSLEGRGFVLTRNGRQVPSRSVDWSRADIRAYDVYQASGDDNVLGQVKFLFPNQHAVYLHDTPKRHLFNSSVRAFSHGCVRLRKPIEFAQLVLKDDKGWSAEHVAELTESGPLDNAISLSKPLPVHIVYFTAWVDDDGTLRTMRDIYGHQERVTLALEGRWADIDKGKDHLAPIDMADIRRDLPAWTTSRSARPVSAQAWSAPMGLFGSGFGSAPARSSGSSANDIFRRSFGN